MTELKDTIVICSVLLKNLFLSCYVVFCVIKTWNGDTHSKQNVDE